MPFEHEPWTKFDPADKRKKPSYLKDWVECPQCKGHTKCIIAEDEYGPGKHFKRTCGNCGGMCPIGFVPPGKDGKACLHTWGKRTKIGRNFHKYECTKCGATKEIDSGD